MQNTSTMKKKIGGVFFFFFGGFGVIWHSIVAITTKCRKKNTIQKSCDGHNAIE